MLLPNPIGKPDSWRVEVLNKNHSGGRYALILVVWMLRIQGKLVRDAGSAHKDSISIFKVADFLLENPLELGIASDFHVHCLANQDRESWDNACTPVLMQMFILGKLPW